MPHTKSNTRDTLGRQASLQAVPTPQQSLLPLPTPTQVGGGGGTEPSVSRFIRPAPPPLQASLQLWGAS